MSFQPVTQDRPDYIKTITKYNHYKADLSESFI